VGILEQPRGETLVIGRGVIAEHTRHEPDCGFYHDEGRKLSTSENEVSDGQLTVHQVVGYALVHALVATAKQRERSRPCGFLARFATR
jgi:hypothetical protein